MPLCGVNVILPSDNVAVIPCEPNELIRSENLVLFVTVIVAPSLQVIVPFAVNPGITPNVDVVETVADVVYFNVFDVSLEPVTVEEVLVEYKLDVAVGNLSTVARLDEMLVTALPVVPDMVNLPLENEAIVEPAAVFIAEISSPTVLLLAIVMLVALILIVPFPESPSVASVVAVVAVLVTVVVVSAVTDFV